MNLSRRGFLGRLLPAAATAAAAPLIVEPTLEELERLFWRRRLFPGWSPPALKVGDRFTIAGVLANETLGVLREHLIIARAISNEYGDYFLIGEPRIGETLKIRTPAG